MTSLEAANAAMLKRRATMTGRGDTPPIVDGRRLRTSDKATEPPVSWALKNAADVLAGYQARDGVDSKRPSFPSVDLLALSVVSDLPESLHEGDNIPDGSIQDGISEIKIHPSLYALIMREEMAHVARLLVIAQIVDGDRNGRVLLSDLRSFILERGIIGKRQINKLLRAGRGVFWKQTKTHIFTFAPDVIAKHFELERFNGRPVFIPVTAVLGSLREFKAVIYAAFHAGRADIAHPAVKKPIARETLTAVLGASASAQQNYDAVAGVKVDTNYALLATNDAQGAAWQHGAAAFAFVDFHGKNGKKGQRSIATQLPNSYTATGLRVASRAGTSRLNETVSITDTHGQTAENPRPISYDRTYARDGKQAERLAGDGGYWNGNKGLWFEQRTPYPYMGVGSDTVFPVF